MIKAPSQGWAAMTAALILLTACAAEETVVVVPDESRDKDAYFSIAIGGSRIEAQLAVKESEMKRGLMYRKSMGSHRGMLFVYEQAGQLGFWMRNTFIPLDIGFFDANGVLREIRPMYPHDETSVRPKDETIQFALETNAGWHRENGIRPGAKMDLQAVSKALRARGFDPARYGLPALP